MKCPVCDNVNTSMLCPNCGFDSSRDYGKYPTFGLVKNAQSVSIVRREWLEEQKSNGQPPVQQQKKKKLLRLPFVAGFTLGAVMVGLFFIGSAYLLPAEQGGSEPIQLPVETTTQTIPPEITTPLEIVEIQNLSPFVDVAASWTHIAALHADGTVSVAIEDGRDEGQGNTQQWENITDIDVGYYHTVGLRADGTVVATGANGYGQCNVSEWGDIVAITAGDDFTVGLKSDGTLIATGNNDSGQCDVGSLENIIAIEASDFSLQCLDSAGRWILIGDGSWHGDNGKNLGIVKLGAGHYNSAGIRSDGTAKMVSNNDYVTGKLDISSWDHLIDISVGGTHILGLRSDGTVLAVGNNEYGECDVSQWTDIIAICAANGHSVGVRADGTLMVTGNYINTDSPCDVTALNKLIKP